MKTSPRWDRVFAFISWVIAIVLLYAAVQVWFIPPTGDGPIASALGIEGAQIFYSALYSLGAVVLGLSKLFKKKRLRKHTLLGIYLVGFCTTLLTFSVIGWTPKLIDNLVLSGTSAICWLYWKFKTEYITIEQFDEDCWQLREDTPDPLD